MRKICLLLCIGCSVLLVGCNGRHAVKITNKDVFKNDCYIEIKEKYVFKDFSMKETDNGCTITIYFDLEDEK